MSTRGPVNTTAVVVAVAIACAGLALLAYVVLLSIAVSNFGSNK